MSLDISASALTAHATSLDVTANNVANVDTDGYKARQAVLEAGPSGNGVRVADVFTSSEPGPAYPTYGPSGAVENVERSNVDLPREMTGMISDQRAFEASAAALRTADGMTGTLLDMRI